MNEKIKETLEKQLQLLSECSQKSNIKFLELTEVTKAMCQVASLLEALELKDPLQLSGTDLTAL